MHFDLKEIIQSFGYVGGYLVIWGIIFAESGLLVGFFLPGDSLLFTSGFLASQNLLNIWILIAGAFICAVLGDNVGYITGKKFGRSLFQKEDSRFFHKQNLIKAEQFYEKHGKKTIVLARFTPVIRTFAPILAGVSEMTYKTFFTYNVIGGFIWTFGLTIFGYFLGKVIPDVDKYLLPIVVAIIIISLLPSIIHLYGERNQKK
ncbi:putative membrane-associated protein [Synechococcus sp. PCC 7502]|uniref:DedA family protein n=1 Tax=Synechococcus sp. PCC 7502 TaxID=1173263 RepID=UPI00029FAC4D|nr:VTT domain-containing protein [Synechococcus sp. PCC 7502]AFY72483.1 putative membrane-associated protein [Synechococcus sp. PCC 7502]